MTNIKVSQGDLEQTRIDLIKTLNESFTTDERKFLLSIKDGSPEWSQLGLPNIEKLPAIQWKLINILKMNSEKRRLASEKLARVLGV